MYRITVIGINHPADWLQRLKSGCGWDMLNIFIKKMEQSDSTNIQSSIKFVLRTIIANA